MGIYKRKQESKKTRKKTRSRPRKKESFFPDCFLGRKRLVFLFSYFLVFLYRFSLFHFPFPFHLTSPNFSPLPFLLFPLLFLPFTCPSLLPQRLDFIPPWGVGGRQFYTPRKNKITCVPAVCVSFGAFAAQAGAAVSGYTVVDVGIMFAI